VLHPRQLIWLQIRTCGDCLGLLGFFPNPGCWGDANRHAWSAGGLVTVAKISSDSWG
jgi:hypothetical protein